MPNGLLRLRFERSGGLVPLTVGGSVAFHEDQGEVAADAGGDDRRTLSQDELGLFKKLDVEALGASAFSAEGGAAPGQPDRYQYDVVLETKSGRRVALRFGEQPAPALNGAAHGLGDLAEWVRREVAEIWKKKTAQKP